MGDVSAKVIGICVSLVMAGVMLPIGLEQIDNATTTGWDPAVITIFQVVLPVLGVIGIAVAFWKD